MASSWTVVSQRQTTDLDPSGRFGDVMEVTFRTSAGTVGSVRIPLDRYTAEYVAEAIESYVAHISAVEQL